MMSAVDDGGSTIATRNASDDAAGAATMVVPAAAHVHRDAWRWWQHTWRLLLLAAVIFGSMVGGLWLRERVWEWTVEIRFHGDIDNGFRWGKRADREGYFSLYERLGEPARDRERIDYAPFRLGLMTYWVHTLRQEYPDNPLGHREKTAEFHRPLLTFNAIMGLGTAIGAFLVARHAARWRKAKRRQILDPSPSSEYTGEEANVWDGTWIALAVAILTWVNPLILLNAHAWPQWDVWPMPFFLFALYCSLRRWWLAAGMIVGLGAGLKGQILTVGWVLPAFALFIGDWRGTLRFTIGIAASLAIIALPWAISTWDRSITTTRAFDLLDRQLLWRGAILVGSLTAGFSMLMLLITRRIWTTTLALVFAAAVAYSTYYCGGTDYWMKSSFVVGTWNYQEMTMGTTTNLPAILRTYGFNNVEEVVLTLPQYTLWTTHNANGTPTPFILGGDVTMKVFLRSLFIGLSIFCAAVAAIRFRQRDARAIVALCLPWAIFYAVPAQIHERYLLFASACAAMFLIVGRGWFLLGTVFMVIGFFSTLHTAVGSGRHRIEPNYLSAIPSWPWEFVPVEVWGFLLYVCRGTYPGIAWGLLFAIAACLVGLCTPGRRGMSVDER